MSLCPPLSVSHCAWLTVSIYYIFGCVNLRTPSLLFSKLAFFFFFLSAKRVAVNDFDLLDMLQFVGISPREALRINCSVPAENMTWIIWNIISANLESEGLFYAQELNFLFLLRAKFWVVDIIKWSYSFFLFFFLSEFKEVVFWKHLIYSHY